MYSTVRSTPSPPFTVMWRLQNNAEDSVGLINLENRSAITELSVRLNRAGAVARLDEVAHARKRLAGNGNPLLVFESLFCALIP